ncbi:PRC-barrel domain-containing protein [soil metagenome]
MSLLLRATDLIGRPVVTIDHGDDIAEVKDVVYGASVAELLGFTLRRRGLLAGPLKRVLPFGAVAAMGRDAIMIESVDGLEDRTDALAQDVKASPDRVLGNDVITDDGVQLGSVVDVIILCAGRPEVGGYEINASASLGDRAGSRVLIPLPDTLSVSGEALMVPASARDFVVDDLAGFGAAVEQFRRRLASPSADSPPAGRPAARGPAGGEATS